MSNIQCLCRCCHKLFPANELLCILPSYLQTIEEDFYNNVTLANDVAHYLCLTCWKQDITFEYSTPQVEYMHKHVDNSISLITHFNQCNHCQFYFENGLFFQCTQCHESVCSQACAQQVEVGSRNCICSQCYHP